eukprot:6197538-Pleurochrysis_carterae.AAC.1
MKLNLHAVAGTDWLQIATAKEIYKWSLVGVQPVNGLRDRTILDKDSSHIENSIVRIDLFTVGVAFGKPKRDFKWHSVVFGLVAARAGTGLEHLEINFPE